MVIFHPISERYYFTAAIRQDGGNNSKVKKEEVKLKMVVKKTISNITRGADLLKPRPDLQYVAAAIVGVTVMMIVYKGAQMAFDRFSMLGQSYNPMSPKPDYKAALGIV